MTIMQQNTLKTSLWNTAGMAGLALGAVSSAYLFAGQFLAGDLAPAPIWQQAVAMVLWAVKFIACIWLMKFFMTKFAKDNSVTDRRTIFDMGMATAFLSALMFSAIYLANMLYISPEFYQQIFQTTLQRMAPALDSNKMAAMEKIIGRLPQITFFYNLAYCFLFGTALSAILSRSIPPKNKFSE